MWDDKLDLDTLSRIPRNTFKVSASHKEEVANQAVDGDVGTRWGSGSHQDPSMTFTIQFNKPTRVALLKFELAEWAHDYPRVLVVELEDANGLRSLLYPPEQYNDIRYLTSSDTGISFFLPDKDLRSITLKQLGEHPVFDWSIAEIELFGPRG